MVSKKILKQNRAFAMVSVLLILMVVTIAVTAFLTNMRIERTSARSFLNIVKANEVAASAVDTAIASLKKTIDEHPDAVSVWEQFNNVAGKNTDMTALYYRDRPMTESGSTGYKIFPLASGGSEVQASSKDNAFSEVTTKEPPDLNSKGWIGALPGEPTNSYHAPWIEIKDNRGKVVGRFAYWMEDESFKVNVNMAGNKERGSSSYGQSAAEMALQPVLESQGSADSLAERIVRERERLPGGRLLGFKQINNATEKEGLADAVKFIATASSSALNFSRHGSLRLSLNSAVKDSSSAGEIRKQLDMIVGTIRHHVPDFGQRFYRSGGNLNSKIVSDEHQNIYLKKIAANIRDYIDTDSQPTVIKPGNSVDIGNAPVMAIGSPSQKSDIIAFGKEYVPLLQEVIMHVTQRAPLQGSPPAGTPSAPYDIDIDYYFEFWNMGAKDIKVSDIGPNPFIKVANQMAWWTAPGAKGIPEGRDYAIPLSSVPGLIFKAGDVTVITTDPTPDINKIPGASGINMSRVYKAIIPDQHRTFKGTTTFGVNSPGFGGYATLMMDTRDEPCVKFATGYDIRTEFFLGNNLGYLDSVQFAFPIAPSILVDAQKTKKKTDTAFFHWRGGVLPGNKTSADPEQIGDPRANSEDLEYSSYPSKLSTSPNRYQFTGEYYKDNTTLKKHSMTSLNENQTAPLEWVPEPMTAYGNEPREKAIAFIANSSLYSVGELGNIYDPTHSTPNIGTAKGGGKTLSIGQKDRLWDEEESSDSRQWTAWRLVDIFSITNLLTLEGLVNINGVTRDKGVALRAALYRYKFLSDRQSEPLETDPGLAGKPLSESAVDDLIAQIEKRLQKNPFLERGEISEFDMFSSGSELAGIDLAKANDRGREELCRRLMELITTRGSTFSVYVQGEAIQETPSGGQQVLSSVRRKVTFKLTPQYEGGKINPEVDNANFDGSSSSELKERFRKPDKYAIEIVSIST